MASENYLNAYNYCVHLENEDDILWRAVSTLISSDSNYDTFTTIFKITSVIICLNVS